MVTQALMSVPPFVMKIGQPEGRQLAPRRELGQPFALLLLGSEEEDRHRPERRVGGDRDRDRRIDPRQFLDCDCVGDGVAAAAAVLLREGDAHEAELREL